MERYNPKKLEQKWSKKWLEEKIYEPDLAVARRPFYNLMMFPYPSAEGLHIGAVRTFSGVDIYGRFKRMQGYGVFEPIGLDGFGIHSENYALKIGKHPIQHAKDSEKNFYRQLSEIGNGFAWNEKLETYDPEYYKWTQWIFVQMFKHGLAYRKKAPVNWCIDCKTVLADEQVVGGECERCGSKAEKKELEQWFFRITDYAGRLLKNLEKLDWSERVKIAQKNWIGKSEGAFIDFEIKTTAAPNFVLIHGYKSSPDKVFFPWVKKELEDQGYKVQIPTLPQPDDPRVEEQVSHVLQTVSFDENTVLVGHSLGSTVALKVLERLSTPVRKTVLIAGFIENRFLDDDEFDEYTFNWDFDAGRIRKNAGGVIALRDMTDDVIPNDQSPKIVNKFGGCVIDFYAEKPHASSLKEPEVLRNILDSIKIFTTRPDTLFGATYMVLAPEHPLIKNQESGIKNYGEVENYIKKAKAKTEEERIAEGKEKTGIELKGIKAINPSTKEEIPIWVADYVLGHVGTGAIMAVPAHDQRDFEFAEKFDLPVRQVIEPFYIQTSEPGVYREGEPIVSRNGIITIVKHWSEDKYIGLRWKKVAWGTFITGGIEKGQTAEEAGIAEIREETGYLYPKFVRELGIMHGLFYHVPKKENRLVHGHILYFELQDGAREEISEEEDATHEVKWLTIKELHTFLTPATHTYALALFCGKFETFTGAGVLMNSDKFDGMDSEKAKWEITKLVGGARKMQYRLRDWLISRQRYWGPPIPMIFCENCKNSISGSRTSRGKSDFQKLNRGELENPGWIAVSEKDLPVKLPYIKNFRPTGTDKSPLATVEKFYKVRCPKCRGWARRETDVSDAFLDSSWYYIGYLLLKNRNKKTVRFNLTREARKWLPVHMYIGGAEHSVLHLMYARFIAMALHDFGTLPFEEPFTKFRAHGLILKDGAKMSKSRGNVVNPDEHIRAYGADAIRMYLAFLSPLEQDGDFRDTGIKGITRFLERVWRFVVSAASENSKFKIQKALHQAIKKVTEDIENLQYNTAIAALMTLLNKFEESSESVSREHVVVFLKLLAPFAPHITEELYQQLWEVRPHKIKRNAGRSNLQKFESIHLKPWPKYDSKLIQEETFELVVQINGKVRDKFEAPIDISEEEATRLTLEREKVKNIISTQKPRKVIFVPKRLVNIVI